MTSIDENFVKAICGKRWLLGPCCPSIILPYLPKMVFSSRAWAPSFPQGRMEANVDRLWTKRFTPKFSFSILWFLKIGKIFQIFQI